MKRREFIKIGAAAAFFTNFSTPRDQSQRRQQQDRFSISVDPRIELYAVVLTLGDFRGLRNEQGVIEARVVTDFDFSYKREVERRFSRFKGHQAVKLYAGMATNGLFRFGHPPSVMLHLSDPPLLEEKIPVDELLIKMAGSRAKLDEFVQAMRNFAVDAEFMDFYGGHEPAYAQLAIGYRKNMEWDYVKDLEGYYGYRQDAYHLILAPLFHPGGFGPRIKTPEGSYQAYAIVGPKGVAEDQPNFGAGDSMRRLCWHEFSHSFVNHLTDMNLDRLRGPVGTLESRNLPAQVIEQIKTFGLWDVHLADQASEYVVRAVTTRLTAIRLGQEKANEALELEKKEGFSHLDAFCACLEQYEKQRAKYPTLKDYFPQIVAAFEKLAGPGLRPSAREGGLFSSLKTNQEDSE
jgi:hypothetical protein